VQIEAGGIGKGMAVDRIAQFLRSAGIKRGFLNFGTSSITALGAPPGQSSWEAEIRFTDTLSLGVVPLNNASFSLSHSFGQGTVIQGVRYGHVIDPRTAMPLTEARGAAVITESATEGEALSKYLVIRGSLPENGNLSAVIVLENGTRSASPSFARLMKSLPAPQSPKS
jgi:thiamine biosynthesis lipoprotein